jgi:hypothetical protein
MTIASINANFGIVILIDQNALTLSHYLFEVNVLKSFSEQL